MDQAGLLDRVMGKARKSAAVFEGCATRFIFSAMAEEFGFWHNTDHPTVVIVIVRFL